MNTDKELPKPGLLVGTARPSEGEAGYSASEAKPRPQNLYYNPATSRTDGKDLECGGRA
jgi:hypothetical protein